MSGYKENNMPDINWLAVLLAAVAAFAAGAVWYSPVLFSKLWQQEVGMSDEQWRSGPVARYMISAFTLIFVAAAVFAMFIGRSAGWLYGLNAGFHIGLFFVGTMLGVHYLFERQSLKLWLINAGYSTLVFTIIGGVIGAFSQA
jgi:hypothetical protein